MRYLVIDAEDAGQRIDNFLARTLKGLPRSRIYRILRKGEVRVNRGRVRPEYRLQAGDRVRVPPVRLPEPGAPVERAAGRSLEQRIVHEGRRLLVLDKPYGLAVHGGSGVSAGLIEQLRAERTGERMLELVHRLDRETSGLIMVARRRSALRLLHALLREGAVQKRYLALVAGRLQPGMIEAPLATHNRRGGERVVTVSTEGKPARTRFSVLARFVEATFVEVELLTGRTHQIRVHAAHAAHPLAGDRRYGDEDFNARMRAAGLKRLFLHAHALSFAWPDTGEQVELSTPLPPELSALLDRLERSDD